MLSPPLPEGSGRQPDQGLPARIGGWLFRRRTWLPLPLALAILFVPGTGATAARLGGGLALVAAGEALRLWAVRHIGVVSRTRADRSGPLVAGGPFAFVRNPLYIGNLALWAGFAMAAGSPWPMLPAVVLVLGLAYHAIVRWEEALLVSRLGASYREYTERVPRWIPAIRRVSSTPAAPRFSWRDTFFSERGTLVAIGVGLTLVGAKLSWPS